MNNNQLTELAFNKLIGASIKNMSSAEDIQEIQILYMDDTADNGISITAFRCDVLADYLLYEDPHRVTAAATMDAVFALQPDEDQYESGIYTPGEDDKEPLAMGIYIHHVKGMDREGDAELHMFSCIPDYERQHSVFLKTDHEIGKTLIKSTTVPENMKKIRSAWMRVMWGRNQKTKYKGSSNSAAEK